MILSIERYRELIDISSKAIIIKRFGMYLLNFEEIAKNYYLRIDEKPFSVNNQEHLIFLFQDLPDIRSRQMLEEELIDTIKGVEYETDILVDKGKFNNSYTYKLNLDKISKIVAIKLYEKPIKGDVNLSDYDSETISI